MERLTFDGNFCDIAQCRDSACKQDGTCTQKEVWERLKAYEDAGLSPQACVEAREIEETLSGYDYSISRMVELMKADKEGRVVVLPCKVTDKLYVVGKKQIVGCNIQAQLFDNDEYLRLLNEFAGIESRPTTEYNHYDENGEFIGSSVDTDLSDLLDEAGVEVRDDG